MSAHPHLVRFLSAEGQCISQLRTSAFQKRKRGIVPNQHQLVDIVSVIVSIVQTPWFIAVYLFIAITKVHCQTLYQQLEKDVASMLFLYLQLE